MLKSWDIRGWLGAQELLERFSVGHSGWQWMRVDGEGEGVF